MMILFHELLDVSFELESFSVTGRGQREGAEILQVGSLLVRKKVFGLKIFRSSTMNEVYYHLNTQLSKNPQSKRELLKHFPVIVHFTQHTIQVKDTEIAISSQKNQVLEKE